MKSSNTTTDELLLYAVTDRHWLNGATLISQVEAALKGGATFIQLREKNLDDKAFYQEALEIQKLCKEYKVPFVINDNVELAKKIGADGVHVGQSDMEALDVRKVLGDDKIIGVSAQTVEQAELAEKHGADYLGVGAVFPTGSKNDATEVSFETLQEICEHVHIPVIAIGGITRDNVVELSQSGICGIAVISAIFGQTDIEAATADLKKQTKKMLGELQDQGWQYIVFVSESTDGISTRQLREETVRTYISQSDTINGEILILEDEEKLDIMAKLAEIISHHEKTCFFANNDEVLRRIISHLYHMEQEVGKDVGICAFADEKWAKYSGPGITCIEQHPFSMGEAAARLLFDKIEHKEKKEVVYEEIKADICRYESTKLK